MLASQFFASIYGAKCDGKDFCHWCSSPCNKFLIHNDPRPEPGQKRSAALRPDSSFLCIGCWLYRRKSITTTFLDGTLKDRQSWEHQSWIMYDNAIRGLRLPNDNIRLYEMLLAPPKRFCLSLKDKDTNMIQLAVVNERNEVKSGDELFFTVDGVKFSYSPYELQEALLRCTPNGKSPGVGVLTRMLGGLSLMSWRLNGMKGTIPEPIREGDEEEELIIKNPKAGRPPTKNATKILDRVLKT